MKLIIQKDARTIYAYFETEKHYKKTKKQREEPLNPNLLSKDCDLDSMPIGHMEFDICSSKTQKKQSKN